MKRMSQIICRAMILTLIVALLCPLMSGAGAAAPGIPAKVWLNGKPVTFDDAYPRNEDGRVFLPFRAIFEALGAEVSWENDTRTAIAERNGVTVRVPIGSDEIYIIENGHRRELEMDVVSYIEPESGRTYVPVRFMAQAMGCLVGWDQEDQTVILIDHKAIAKEAVKGHSYAYLEDGQSLLSTYQSGGWALEGELQHVIEAKGIAIATTSATFTGLTDRALGSQMFLEMQSDYSTGYLAQAEHLGVSLEDLGVTLEELKADLSMELRTDAAAEKSWMYVNKATGAAAGLLQGEWMETSGTAGINGVDVTELLAVETTLEPEQLVIEALEAMEEPTDRETSMEDLRKRAGAIASNLSDPALTQNGSLYIARWKTGSVLNVLSLEVDDLWNVISCSWDRTMEDVDKGTTRHTYVDKQGNVTEIVTVIGEEQTDTMVESGKYVATTKTPVVSLAEE